MSTTPLLTPELEELLNQAASAREQSTQAPSSKDTAALRRANMLALRPSLIIPSGPAGDADYELRVTQCAAWNASDVEPLYRDAIFLQIGSKRVAWLGSLRALIETLTQIEQDWLSPKRPGATS